MRIAFFLEIFYPEINGVITATLDLVRNLRSRGHHVLIVVPGNRKVEQVKEVDGIEVFTIPSTATFIYPGVRFSNPWDRTLLRKLEAERIELVHITGPWTVAWAAINHAHRLGLPIVHTFHTMLNEDTYLLYFVKLKILIPPARKVMWWFMGKFILASDIITVPSRFACEELRRRYPQKRLHRLSNGINRTAFRKHADEAALREEYPFINKKTFIFIGRLGQEKSLDVLVRGFGVAIKKDKELRLVLVGDGPFRAYLETETGRLGISDKVFFLGKIPHAKLLASGLLHQSRAFVTASVTENQPMTVIEAICCDLPLIMADVQGMRELSSGNALLFPPGDFNALGGLIAELAVNDELYESLKEKSKAFAEEFDGGRVAEEFENIYTESLKENGKPG